MIQAEIKEGGSFNRTRAKVLKQVDGKDAARATQERCVSVCMKLGINVVEKAHLKTPNIFRGTNVEHGDASGVAGKWISFQGKEKAQRFGS